MAGQTTISTAIFRAEEQGVDEVSAKLGLLAGQSQKAVAAAQTLAREQAKSGRMLADGIAVLNAPAVATFAKTTEQSTRALSQMQRQAERLQKSLDPAYREMARFAQIQKEVTRLVDNDIISRERGNELISAGADRFGKFGASARTANDNIKLTSGQMQGLGYQINDVATMLAMGASPFQIMASQAGQVVQVLQEGGGLKSSLSAIGSTLLTVTRAIAPVGLAFAAVGGAAALYFSSIRQKIPDATETLKKHGAALDAIGDRYGELSKTVQSFGADAIAPVSVIAGSALRDLQKLATAQGAELQRMLTGSNGILGAFGRAGAAAGGQEIEIGDLPTLPKLGPIADSVQALRDTLDKGDSSILTFMKSMNDLYATAGDDKDLLTAIETATKFGDALFRTAAAQKQLKQAILEASPAYRQMKADMEQFRQATEDLGSFVPDGRTQRQQIENAYGIAMSKAKTEADERRAMDLRLAGLREIERQEDVSRQGRELDTAAIGAQTVAERALLAAQRERLALSEPGANREEVERAALAASTQVYAQAERDAADALRQSQDARAQAGLEGYAAQVAAINAQYAEQIRLAEGSAAAVEALTQARDLDLQALDVNTRKSLLGSQEEQLRTLREEAGLIGVNDDARRMALATLQAEADLREQGISLNSAWGRTYVENARQIETMESAIDKQTEAFEDLRDAAKEAFLSIGSGKGVMESLVSAFAGLGNKLASDGFDKLTDLFAGGGKGASDIASTIGGLGKAVQQVADAPAYSAGSMGNTYAAPVGQVTRGGALVALSSAASSSVAKAGNAFLDLIGRAEGTDKGRGYNETLSYGAFTGGNRDLVNMTLNQIQALQKQMLANPNNNFNSSALGRYQIVGKTLKGLIGDLGLSGNELFSPKLQDELALQLARGRGGSASGLRNEWEGLRRVDAETIIDAYREGLGGQNVGSSTNDTRFQAKAVSAGVVDANRKLATSYDIGGYDPGTPKNPTGAGSQGGLGGMFSGQGIGLIGAGLGSFASGYQSGSPISGALSGVMAGASFGPPGMIIGAIAGAAGGIFGGRAEREKKHREQAATWADMQPQYLDWQKSVQKARPTSGLSDFFATETANFDKFRETGGAAWKYGTNNSSQDFIDVGTAMFAKFHEIRDAFRDTIDPMIEALEAGRGMDSPFADARNQLYALGDQLLQFVDDTKESLSYRPDEAYRVDEARAAALAQVDQSLDVVEPLSALAEEIERLQGGALGAKKVMQDLGRSAAEAGRVVDEKLVAALAGVGRNLEQDLRDQIADMDGKGYLADFRSLIEDNAAMMATIAANSALNVDTSLVDEFFRKSAQSLVDGAELTGASFDALIAAFPELSGVVKSFTESVESSADAIKARSLGYQDRLFAATTDTSKVGGALAAFDRSAAREREEEIKAGGQAILDLEAALAAERLAIIRDFNDRAMEDAKDFLTGLTRNIKEFTDGLRSGADSPLAPKDRLAAAQKQYDAQLALAKTGDRDAANALTGYATDLLEASKAFNASSPEYQATFNAIIAQLEALPKQVSAEQFIADTIKDTASAQLNATAAMQEALRTAFAAGPGATAAALSSSFSMLDTSLDGLLDYNEMRSALTGIATDAQIRTMMTVLDANGDGQISKLELINAANNRQVTELTGQKTVLNAVVANTQAALGNAQALYGLMTHHRDITLEILRLNQITSQRGYMTGGYTGDGPTTQIAGVVHGQEGVLNARAMRALGRPALDAMNLGQIRMPAIAMPVMPKMANDNGGLEQRIAGVERAIREEVAALRKENTMVTRGAAEHGREGIDNVASEIRSQRRSGKLEAAKAA